jgi:hypothetical protein
LVRISVGGQPAAGLRRELAESGWSGLEKALSVAVTGSPVLISVASRGYRPIKMSRRAGHVRNVNPEVLWITLKHVSKRADDRIDILPGLGNSRE